MLIVNQGTAVGVSSKCSLALLRRCGQLRSSSQSKWVTVANSRPSEASAAESRSPKVIFSPENLTTDRKWPGTIYQNTHLFCKFEKQLVCYDISEKNCYWEQIYAVLFFSFIFCHRFTHTNKKIQSELYKKIMLSTIIEKVCSQY